MQLLKHAPNVEVEQASTFLAQNYGIYGELSYLPSERDQNFLVETKAYGKFVLKIANATEDLTLLEAQNRAMLHLLGSGFCPQLVKTLSGSEIAMIRTTDNHHYSRVVKFIDGRPLAKVEHSANLLNDLGRKVGRLTAGLKDFDHPAFHRQFHWDLKNGSQVILENVSLLDDEQFKTRIADFANLYERDVEPISVNLRRSVVHGDANDYNVIVRDEAVVGLIDFGDMVYSYTVADLAIALAYIVLDKEEPLAAAREVIAGFMAEFPLSEDEQKVLWPMTLMRLCMSACLAAFQERQRPDNDYLSVSQQSIRNSLPGLLRLQL